VVILNGPTGTNTSGWISQVVSTAANTITVRLCNSTGGTAGNGITFNYTYIAIH
jgi:hypothetical protein